MRPRAVIDLAEDVSRQHEEGGTGKRDLAAVVLELGELGVYIGQRIVAHHADCDVAYVDGGAFCETHGFEIARWSRA